MAFGTYDPFGTDESFAQRFNTLYGGMPDAPAAPTQSQFGYVSPVNGTWATGPSNLFHAARGTQGRLHSGNDIQAPMGSPAVAMVGGQVIYTHNDQGYGWNAVVKGTDGNMYRYATHGPLSVKFGQQIKTGDRIGTIANAPGIPGPHLHLEVIPPTINGAPNPAYQKMAANFGRGLNNFVSTQTWPRQPPLTIDPMKFFGVGADTPVALGKPVGNPAKSQAVAAAPDMTNATRDPFGVIQQHIAKEGYDAGQTGVRTGIPPASVGNTPPVVSDTPTTDASRAVSPNILAASQFTGYAPQIRAADYGHPAGPPSVTPASAPATLQNASYTLQLGTPGYLHSPAFYGFTDDFGDTPAHAPGTVPASGPLPRLRPGDTAQPDSTPPPSFSAPLTRGITVSNPSDAAVAAYAKANPATAAEIAAYASQFPGNPAKWYSEPGSFGQQAQMAVARAKMTGAPLPGTTAPAPAATGVVSAITPGKDFVNPDGSPAAAPAPLPNAPGSPPQYAKADVTHFPYTIGSPGADYSYGLGLGAGDQSTAAYGQPTPLYSGADAAAAASGPNRAGKTDQLYPGATPDFSYDFAGPPAQPPTSQVAIPKQRPSFPANILPWQRDAPDTVGPVTQVQTALIKMGLLPPGADDGVNGPQTQNAVLHLNNIADRHAVGPAAYTALKNAGFDFTANPVTSAPLPPLPGAPTLNYNGTADTTSFASTPTNYNAVTNYAAARPDAPTGSRPDDWSHTFGPEMISTPLKAIGDAWNWATGPSADTSVSPTNSTPSLAHPVSSRADYFHPAQSQYKVYGVDEIGHPITDASIAAANAMIKASTPMIKAPTPEAETASTHPALTAQLTAPPMSRLQTTSNNWGDNTKSALSQGVDPAMIANNSIFYNPTLPAPSGVDYNSPSFQDYNNPYGGNDYSNPGGIP